MDIVTFKKSSSPFEDIFQSLCEDVTKQTILLSNAINVIHNLNVDTSSFVYCVSNPQNDNLGLIRSLIVFATADSEVR